MPPNVRYTLDEYLALEEKTVREALDEKYEFDGAEVYALAGASLEHNLIGTNLSDETPPSLLNPEWVVEIASPSTSDKDRTWKLEAYLQIETLQELWLVETESPRVQQYLRMSDEWVLRIYNGTNAEIECKAFSITISMTEIYRRVFDA